MTAFGNTLENNLLEHIFRDTSYSQPGTIYVGLFTGTVGDDYDGSGNEVSGGSYARAAVDASNAKWNAASAGTVTNNGSIEFAQATAEWGTVIYVALLDHLTATVVGSLLFHGSINGNKIVGSADTFKFNDTALSIALD